MSKKLKEINGTNGSTPNSDGYWWLNDTYDKGWQVVSVHGDTFEVVGKIGSLDCNQYEGLWGGKVSKF